MAHYGTELDNKKIQLYTKEIHMIEVVEPQPLRPWSRMIEPVQPRPLYLDRVLLARGPVGGARLW
jgi:hypothetical protein